MNFVQHNSKFSNLQKYLWSYIFRFYSFKKSSKLIIKRFEASFSSEISFEDDHLHETGSERVEREEIGP